MNPAELLDTMAMVSIDLEAMFGTFRKNHSVHISRFAVTVFELFSQCPLQSTITTGHWSPEKLPSLSARGMLLSSATIGFKSNAMASGSLVTAQKNRAEILGWQRGQTTA